MFKIPVTVYEGNASRATLPVQVVPHLVNPVKGGRLFEGSVTASISCEGMHSVVTPNPRDPALDIVFDCSLQDSAGNPDRGKLVATATILGTWINVAITADVPTATLTLLGTWCGGITASGLLTATITLKPDDYVPFASPVKENWVKWSNIGSLDFTIWKDNVAGERPLDWKGFVYSVKKLGNKVVAYGENGISILVPAGSIYGLQTVHRTGLKGKQAVAGDNTAHFFVDTKGDLYFLGEMAMKSSLFEASMQPRRLGYSEYLLEMNDLVLSWDGVNRLLYICDGAKGYVYSPHDKSLGDGPVNITGVGSQDGTLYVVSPAAITTPVFEICTDIYDFGTNKYKTIHELEFGTNISGTLQAAIDYRDNVKLDFTQTAWKDVSPGGNVYITALGREFRFKAKIGTYEYFELDYITTRGFLHDH